MGDARSTTLVELAEYETVEARLTPQQALLVRESGVVDVNPAWSSGAYRLTAGATVGVLDLGAGLTVRIMPKLPVRRVVYLLCHAAGLARWDEGIIDLDDDAPIDVALAEAFVVAAERALRHGPRSSYYMVEDDLNELRGRLDVNRQRLRYGLPLPVAVTYDEFGIDIPENRLLLGAALQLKRRLTLTETLRRRLQRIALALDGAQPARRDQARATIQFSRLNESYRPAIALARAILEDVSFDLHAGGRPIPGFAVDMNKLFESFLAAALAEELHRGYSGRLHAQRSTHLDQGHTALIRPDLTWIEDGIPQVVVDAKYKDRSGGRAADSDLYQVISYCVALGITRGFLVHATTAAQATLTIKSSDIQVVVTGLDLSSPLDDLRRQVADLAGAIARRQHVLVAG